MIFVDDSFPYGNYKGKEQLFETYAIEEYEVENSNYSKITLQIEYSKELGMYRISRFKDGHWDGDIVFDEVEKNEFRNT